MNGQEKQNSLALYVSIIVIIGLAIVFIIIFILYSIKKGKHISYGNEDETLKLDIDKKISSLEEKDKYVEAITTSVKEYLENN